MVKWITFRKGWSYDRELISPLHSTLGRCLYHVWNVRLLVEAIPWPTNSLDARTRTISSRSILQSMMGDGLFGSCLMARLVSDPILGVLGWKKSLERVERGQYFKWVRDYFSWSSSCRTSLPLVRHFARPPSHHRSLASSSESLKSRDTLWKLYEYGF